MASNHTADFSLYLKFFEAPGFNAKAIAFKMDVLPQPFGPIIKLNLGLKEMLSSSNIPIFLAYR